VKCPLTLCEGFGIILIYKLRPLFSQPMITLDAKYHDYLTSGKTFDLDGCRERVTGYGYNCDGNGITGYYVNTENWRLNYDLQERFIDKEELHVR